MGCNYGCKNPFEGCYTLSPAGDCQAKAEYFVNSAIPSYAGMFYSPTEHELIADIKYDRTTADYDRHQQAIIDSIRGPPLDFYVPFAASPPDGGSAVPKTGELIESAPKNIEGIKPAKKIVEEIARAQREVAGREIIIQQLELEEIIIRRARKRQIRIKQKEL
jgi:hypothetical protein